MKAKAILLAVLLPTGVLAGDANSPAVLGHLETRGRMITIFAGEKPMYTIKTKDGKMLADHVTLDQLQKKDPVLAKFLRDAIGPNRGVADASLHPSLQR